MFLRSFVPRQLHPSNPSGGSCSCRGSAAAVVGQNFSKTQRIVEAASIATEMAINTSPGFFRLATAAANLVKKEASHILQKED